MTEEQAAAMLAMLKTDLGITTAAYDERLAQYITASAAAVTDEGASLDLAGTPDMTLVVMYAAWLWRRRDTGEGMPRMLRYALNNRVMGRKMRDDG